jgi:enoyl-CoA hydratase/carnithine racemase
MMTGELITAEEAHRLHVVNRVVPAAELAGAVDALTGRLATRSPVLMRLGKDALSATADLPLDAALDHLQAQLALAFTTEDIKEGVAAFREKRDPVWRGR